MVVSPSKIECYFICISDKLQSSVSFIPLCQDRYSDEKGIKKTRELAYFIRFMQLDESL